MQWTGSEELKLKYENYLRQEEVPLTDFSFKSRVSIIKLKHLVFIFDSFAIYHLQSTARHYVFEYAGDAFHSKNGHTPLLKLTCWIPIHYQHVCHVPTQEMNCSASKSPLGPSSCISINNGSVHISFNESPLLTYIQFGWDLYRNEKMHPAHFGRYTIIDRKPKKTFCFLSLCWITNMSHVFWPFCVSIWVRWTFACVICQFVNI